MNIPKSIHYMNMFNIDNFSNFLQITVQKFVDEEADNCKVVVLRMDRIFVDGCKMEKDEWLEFAYQTASHLNNLIGENVFYVYGSSEKSFSLTTYDFDSEILEKITCNFSRIV